MSQIERRRPPGAGSADRASGSTRAPARATRSSSPTPGSGRRSSGSPRTGSTMRIDAARRHSLVVDTLHFHAGSGWLGDQLAGFEQALVNATSLPRPAARRRLPDPRGQRRRRASAGRSATTERPVDLDAYAAVVRAPPRAVRRDGRVRAGRLRDEGRGAAARRGGHGRGPGAGPGSSASTSAGTSPARTSSTSTPGAPPGPGPAPRADAAGDDRGPHQRGGRPVRRGLPVRGRRGGGRSSRSSARVATTRRCR